MEISWSDWKSLGKPEGLDPGRPFAQRNQDGRLEVFTRGLGGIFNIAQVAPNGAWRDVWRSKGSPSPDVHLKSHVVGRNADGRQEIFAMADNGALWQKWQVTPNNGWSEWKTLGAPSGDTALSGQFTVGINQDGRQEIFGVGTDGNVWQIWQMVPNGGWSNWAKLGKPPAAIRGADRITVGRNNDGRQELFVMGADNALWHIWQLSPNSGWSDWESLNKPEHKDLSEPVVQQNADGHLEVFSPGNGAFCNRWQEAPNSRVWRHEGWNEKPKPRPAVGLTWLEAARNFENRLEVLAFGDDGALWHAWQVDVAPNWSEWKSLGFPPSKIRQADHLTIGTNQDGRLEAFLVGQDSAVWHIWQVR